MGNTLSLSVVRTIPCVTGWCMCVLPKHGPVAVSEYWYDGGYKLYVCSLEDGSLVRCIGSEGSGKERLSFDFGGLCASPDGDNVLVTERYNKRVQEVAVADGPWRASSGSAC